MSKFFDDTMQGLLEAVAINQKQIPVQKVDGLQADTFRAEDIESNLIDRLFEDFRIFVCIHLFSGNSAAWIHFRCSAARRTTSQ